MFARSQASCIDEFAALVHPRDGHPKLFAMIEAYIDESGIHDGAKVCIVAGYFGGRGQWRRFEQKWRRLLKHHGIEMSEFHAKDFLKKTRHEPFLKAAAKLIRSCEKLHPMGVGVFVDDFLSFSPEERMWMTGADVTEAGLLSSSGSPRKPYFLPFQFCIQIACDYTPVGGRAHFFMGIDRAYAGWATDLFAQMQRGDPRDWKERIGTIAFPLAKETPQLQAADLLVHLTYKHILAAADCTTAPLPPLLADCLHNRIQNQDFFVQDREHLETMFQQAVEFSRLRRLSANNLGIARNS